MKNLETKAAISELARTNCRIMGLELWGVDYFPGPGGKKSIVRIYIDSDQGVGIAQCAELSRNLSVVFDVEDIVPGSYTLEVSSPGLDRKFFSPSQMMRFTGQKIRISLKEALQGRKKFSGSLERVEDSKIVVRSDSDEEWNFDWDKIDKANLAG
jgi:ribosome maturation factor RimP